MKGNNHLIINNMELKDFIVEFADQFDDTDPSEITATTAYHELDEWSSMIALSVMNVIQKKFSKSISFDDMKAAVTVEDLFNIVKNK